MKIDKKNIKAFEKVFRLNLINSITGIKAGNLIATRSNDGADNVAIFSSVVHLGSNPAQIGFVMRPQIERKSDTYNNIKENGFYTINHITKAIYKEAHNTSANLKGSEFDLCDIKKENIDNFKAPFVLESPIKIGMKLIEMIDLPNDCILIVGEVELIDVQESSINEKGEVDLSLINVMGISGLNGYYELQRMDSLPYIRLSDKSKIE